MSTAAATKPRTTRMEADNTSQGAVAVLQPPRLPYHPAIEERFGVDRASWKALTEAIYPQAKTTDSVVMALSYCRARKLDPFKRPVHIVPMWSSAANGYVETVWPGISELRTTAFRTGQYAGCDETDFGPTVERTFTGRVKQGNDWRDKSVTLSFPEWARITVYRDLNGRTCKFVGPKVKWTEAYAAVGNSELPNDMWEGRSEGQLEKCAEAAALRKAFPEELGNMLSAEEMEGRRLAEGGARTPDELLSNGAPKPTLVGALDELAKAGGATAPQVIEVEPIHDQTDSGATEQNGAPANGTHTRKAEKPAKSELLAEIDNLESKLGALQWQRDRALILGELSRKDRLEVDAAFIAKQEKLPT